MPTKLRPLAKCDPVKLRETREEANRCAVAQFMAARRALEWTQLDAAVHLGVDCSTVENWERGKCRIPAEAVVRMRQVAFGRTSIHSLERTGT